MPPPPPNPIRLPLRHRKEPTKRPKTPHPFLFTLHPPNTLPRRTPQPIRPNNKTKPLPLPTPSKNNPHPIANLLKPLNPIPHNKPNPLPSKPLHPFTHLPTPLIQNPNQPPPQNLHIGRPSLHLPRLISRHFAPNCIFRVNNSRPFFSCESSSDAIFHS